MYQTHNQSIQHVCYLIQTLSSNLFNIYINKSYYNVFVATHVHKFTFDNALKATF